MELVFYVVIAVVIVLNMIAIVRGARREVRELEAKLKKSTVGMAKQNKGAS